MAQFVSQPLTRPLAPPIFSKASREAQPTFMPTAYALPDAYDSRYPRRFWMRAIRGLASAWWVPLVVYITQAATLLLLAEQAARFATPPDGMLVARALHVAWVPMFILEQPAGLVMLVFGLVALLLALIGGIAAGRWVKADRRLEAQVLMLRLARPEERANSTFLRNAIGPALAWRLNAARARRRLMTLALAIVSIAAGVLIALSARPIGG
jgi:hypothetical protein